MKKAIITILSLVILLSTLTPMVWAKEDIKVIVDGRKVEFDQQPVMDENNRTLVPIRFISESLGASVDWDKENQAAIIIQDDKTIKLTVGSKNATINDKTYQLDTSAKLVNGRTLVPVRFVSEALNAEVIWLNETQTIYINSNKGTQLTYQEAFVYPKTPEAIAGMLRSLPSFKGELIIFNDYVYMNLKGTGFDAEDVEDMTMQIGYTAIYEKNNPRTADSPGVIDYYVTLIHIDKLGNDEKALLKDILKKYYPTQYEKAFEDSIYTYEREFVSGLNGVDTIYDGRTFFTNQGWNGGITIWIGE